MGRLLSFWMFVSVLSLAASAAQAITINVIFNPGHPSSSGTFLSTEQAVIREAARAWAALIPSSGIVDVTAVRSSVPANQGLLGLATAYQSSGGTHAGRQVGMPTAGTILLSDAAPWFVDGTPGDDSEFSAQVVSPVPGLAPSFLTALPGGGAAGSFDLLSVAFHEIGHVLGFTSAYEDFALAVQPSPDTAQQVYVFGAAASLGDPVVDYFAGFFAHGGVYLPQTEENPDEAGSVGGIPSHLDTQNLGGQAAGLFPQDLMNPGIALGERRRVSFVDLDILADAIGYTVVPEPATAWLLAAGLTAAVAVRRLLRASQP